MVSEVILTHRGERATVEVAGIPTADDYTLVVPGGSTPLLGQPRSSLEFAAGERFTVL